MKKPIFAFLLILCIFSVLEAQIQHTNYGTSSGTLGDYSSFFGYNAGNASTNSGNYNSFFGAQSGKSTTSGVRNSALGY